MSDDLLARARAEAEQRHRGDGLFQQGARTRVVIRDASGKEVDWFDPVYSFDEREGHWAIEGVSHFYSVKIKPGMTYEIQDLEASDE